MLDLTAKRPGDEIWPDDLAAALERIEYTLKPLDIVLLRTDAANFREEKRYLTDHPGMTREATIWLLDRGVMTMGIDAPGFDLPVPFMFEKKKFWEVAHGDARARVLSPREHVQPGSDPAPLPQLHRQRPAGEVARRLAPRTCGRWRSSSRSSRRPGRRPDGRPGGPPPGRGSKTVLDAKKIGHTGITWPKEPVEEKVADVAAAASPHSRRSGTSSRATPAARRPSAT